MVIYLLLRQLPLLLVLSHFLQHVVNFLSIQIAVTIIVVLVEYLVEFELEFLFAHGVVLSFAVVVPALAMWCALLATAHP